MFDINLLYENFVIKSHLVLFSAAYNNNNNNNRKKENKNNHQIIKITNVFFLGVHVYVCVCVHLCVLTGRKKNFGKINIPTTKKMGVMNHSTHSIQ